MRPGVAPFVALLAACASASPAADAGSDAPPSDAGIDASQVVDADATDAAAPHDVGVDAPADAGPAYLVLVGSSADPDPCDYDPLLLRTGDGAAMWCGEFPSDTPYLREVHDDGTFGATITLPTLPSSPELVVATITSWPAAYGHGAFALAAQGCGALTCGGVDLLGFTPGDASARWTPAGGAPGGIVAADDGGWLINEVYPGVGTPSQSGIVHHDAHMAPLATATFDALADTYQSRLAAGPHGALAFWERGIDASYRGYAASIAGDGTIVGPTFTPPFGLFSIVAMGERFAGLVREPDPSPGFRQQFSLVVLDPATGSEDVRAPLGDALDFSLYVAAIDAGPRVALAWTRSAPGHVYVQLFDLDTSTLLGAPTEVGAGYEPYLLWTGTRLLVTWVDGTAGTRVAAYDVMR